MKEYTEKIHAERLLKMLNKKNPCLCCPASRRYDFCDMRDMWNQTDYRGDRLYSDYLKGWDAVCKICAEFVGLKPKTNGGETCPCVRLRKKRSIKRTWLALEAKGYLDDENNES